MEEEELSYMETFLISPGFQHIIEEIFANLDPPSLANCRLLSTDAKDIIDEMSAKDRRILRSHILWLRSKYNHKWSFAKREKYNVARMFFSINVCHQVFEYFSGINDMEEMGTFITFMKYYRLHFKDGNLLGFMHSPLKSRFIEMLSRYPFYMDQDFLYSVLWYGWYEEMELFISIAKNRNVKLNVYESYLVNDLLFRAARYKNVACFNFILEHALSRRIRISDTDNIGNGIMHIAAQKYDAFDVSDLSEKTKIQRSIQFMEFLLENAPYFGININGATHYMYGGKTPMHVACTSGYPEVVALMLKGSIVYGINVNATNHMGKTPLFMACVEKRIDIIEVMAKHGGQEINWNVTDSIGRTPLHLACMRGNVEVVQTLLKHSNETNINVNQKDVYGKAPIHIACTSHCPQIIELMLNKSKEHGIDVNAVNNLGKTPVYIACYEVRIDVIKLMIKHAKREIDWKCKDTFWRTPLQVACNRLATEVVQVLLTHSHEIDLGIEHKDIYGKKARDYGSLDINEIFDKKLRVRQESPEPEDIKPSYPIVLADPESQTSRFRRLSFKKALYYSTLLVGLLYANWIFWNWIFDF